MSSESDISMAVGTPTVTWGPAAIQPRPGALVVGRGDDVDCRLFHPATSRVHARISLLKDLVHVKDLKSRGGVRVNGARIKEQALKAGDRVEFGPVTYYFDGRLLQLQTLPGATLRTKDLTVIRGDAILLSHVELLLEPNQFVGILGPSGAGKSTLIKCLASVFPPYSGDITFDGRNVWQDLDGYRSVAGYVPQQDVLFPSLTARENLQFALRLRSSNDLSTREQIETIDSVLAQVSLTDHADKPVAVLSGGQRKRVNVAIELLTRPRVLILDEPTSGLDPASETRLMLRLKRIASWGTTVVCATHVMENLRLFDQVVVLSEGFVVYRGTPAKMLQQFGAANFADFYAGLEDHLPEVSLCGVPIAELAPSTGSTLTPPASSLPCASPRIRLKAQVGILLQRGGLLILRDKHLLALLIGQPILIGLLINLSQLSPNGTASIFLFSIVASIWLGLNNTAREIVRERAVYTRERLAGMTPRGYLIAKAVLFGGVGLLQLIIMYLIVQRANVLTEFAGQDLRAWGFFHVVSVLWVTYLCSMFLGLAISAFAASEEVAVAVLPLIILPQLLLTGVATGTGTNRDGSFRSLYLLISHASESTRGFTGWIQEAISFFTVSRPAASILANLRTDEVSAPIWCVRLIDWGHLCLLLSATAWLSWRVLHRQESKWMR